MGKHLKVTVERAHTRPFEVDVLDGPNSAQVRDAIRRSPYDLARWVLARDRIFLVAADVLHSELFAVPKSLGLVYSTDGGLWWDEGREGFRLYVNDPARESLISTEPVFWRMVRPHPVFVLKPEHRHHHDTPPDAWIELLPDTPPERASIREVRYAEAAERTWWRFGNDRLLAFEASLGAEDAGNYGAHIRAKSVEAREAGTPTVWNDGDRMRSGRVDWRCDETGSFAHLGSRKVAVTWSDRFTMHPLYREMMLDHYRIVRVDAVWDDGEALDPVDRIVVEAEICGMMESDGIETIPPGSVGARQAKADALVVRAEGEQPAAEMPKVVAPR